MSPHRHGIPVLTHVSSASTNWKDAEADLRAYQQAKAEYAALGNRSNVAR